MIYVYTYILALFPRTCTKVPWILTAAFQKNIYRLVVAIPMLSLALNKMSIKEIEIGLDIFSPSRVFQNLL